MSAGNKQEYSPAAAVAFGEFLAPFEAALEALGPLGGTPRGDTAGRRSWLVATALSGRGKLDRVGEIGLRRRSLEDHRVRVDVHSTLELFSKTVLTAEGHLVCLNDPWSSLESWDVRIEQRSTRASKKVSDEDFDRVCRGRVVGDTFKVEGHADVSLPGGPIVSELAVLESTDAMVEARSVHVVRDFDAIARQQHFEHLGVARTPWGDRQVVLQMGVASLPTTYWLGPSGRAAIVRQGNRLLVERTASAEWPGTADG